MITTTNSVLARIQAIYRKCKSKLTVILALALANPAFAQVEKVNETAEMIQAVLISISVVVISIALIWAGFKMAFQHAKWADISNIVIGSVLAGGAPGLAAWLIG